MKYTYLIVLLFTVQSVFSQLDYGGTVGFQSSRFTNEFNTINGSYVNLSNPGFSIGGYVDYNLSDNIHFYGKLQFLQIGDREDGGVVEDEINVDTIDYKLNYISIPLNIKFFNKFYVFLGPQANILVSYDYNKVDFGSPESKVDIGGNIGFGYDFGKLRSEIMFYQGVTNLLEFEPFFQGGSPLIIRNTYINFNLSYSLSD